MNDPSLQRKSDERHTLEHVQRWDNIYDEQDPTYTRTSELRDFEDGKRLTSVSKAETEYNLPHAYIQNFRLHPGR